MINAIQFIESGRNYYLELIESITLPSPSSLTIISQLLPRILEIIIL